MVKQQNVMVSLGLTPPLMVLEDTVQISCLVSYFLLKWLTRALTLLNLFGNDQNDISSTFQLKGDSLLRVLGFVFVCDVSLEYSTYLV